MRILEICLYSAGIDGVFTRVKQEAMLLSKRGHEVKIFSSNLVKGSNEIALADYAIENVRVKRFKTQRLGGESYMIWKPLGALRKEIIDYKPDVIISHSYRHSHTNIASKIAKEIGAKFFLVTHAPFGNDNRSLIARWYIKFFHDPFIGKRTLKRCNKVISITKWELPYLLNLDVDKEKIEYIPNGISNEFFKIKTIEEENKILFLGRISPIKDIETLIKSLPLIKDKQIKLEIVGMAEKNYLNILNNLTYRLNLEKRVKFSEAIFENKEKIRKIDSAKIFVLPSKREGMSQSLIEALARKKIVIASKNSGNTDIINDGENGFLFEIGDERDLAKKINYVINVANKEKEKIKKNALKSVEQFNWNKIIDKIENLIVKN